MTVAKLALYISLQKRWKAKHLKFENDFSNVYLKRFVYSQVPSHTFSDMDKKYKVMKLNTGLYESKDVGRAWSEL